MSAIRLTQEQKESLRRGIYLSGLLNSSWFVAGFTEKAKNSSSPVLCSFTSTKINQEGYVRDQCIDVAKKEFDDPAICEIYLSLESKENCFFETAKKISDEKICEKVSDMEAKNIARDIATQIEQELKYPGEIKVNVIRESRVIEYAR